MKTEKHARSGAGVRRLSPEEEAARLAVLDFLEDLGSHGEEGLEWISNWCSDALELPVDPVDVPAETEPDAENDEEPEPEPGEEPVDVSDAEEESGGEADPTDGDGDGQVEIECEVLGTYRSTLADSLKGLEGFRIGYNPDPADWSKGVAILMDAVSGMATGIIPIDIVRVILKGVSFEREMIKARAEGELAGRNARIEEQLVSAKKTDGLPSLNSGSGGRPLSTRPASIFDLASQARI